MNALNSYVLLSIGVCRETRSAPAFNAEFSHLTRETGSAFVPLAGIDLEDYLCERYERVAGKDNCVQFRGLQLQIPQDRHRYHYVKAKVHVSKPLDGRLSIDHRPLRLDQYTVEGKLLQAGKESRKVA